VPLLGHEGSTHTQRACRQMGRPHGGCTCTSPHRLWESAQRTSHSLPARLAVEHCVHEARGLDVLPATVAKFRNNHDDATADLLQNLIYPVSPPSSTVL
jgi:uncharacterized ferritin-like protein (DUF455 family)